MASLGFGTIRHYGREKKAQAFDTHMTTLLPTTGYRVEKAVFDGPIVPPWSHSDVVVLSTSEGIEKTLPISLFEVSEPKVPRPSARLRATFESLRQQWAEASATQGSPIEMFIHPAYQRIIGLGPDAVPLIVEALRERPDHWFWALSAITGVDPAEGITSFKRAREAWLSWAVEQGHLR
jgi:hypothetical protein